MKLSNTYLDYDSDIWFVSINDGLFFKGMSGIRQSYTYPVANIHKLILRHNLIKLSKG